MFDTYWERETASAIVEHKSGESCTSNRTHGRKYLVTLIVINDGDSKTLVRWTDFVVLKGTRSIVQQLINRSF